MRDLLLDYCVQKICLIFYLICLSKRENVIKCITFNLTNESIGRNEEHQDQIE